MSAHHSHQTAAHRTIQDFLYSDHAWLKRLTALEAKLALPPSLYQDALCVHLSRRLRQQSILPASLTTDLHQALRTKQEWLHGRTSLDTLRAQHTQATTLLLQYTEELQLYHSWAQVGPSSLLDSLSRRHHDTKAQLALIRAVHYGLDFDDPAQPAAPMRPSKSHSALHFIHQESDQNQRQQLVQDINTHTCTFLRHRQHLLSLLQDQHTQRAQRLRHIQQTQEAVLFSHTKT